MRKVTHYFPYNQIYLRKKHTKKHHNELSVGQKSHCEYEKDVLIIV